MFFNVLRRNPGGLLKYELVPVVAAILIARAFFHFKDFALEAIPTLALFLVFELIWCGLLNLLFGTQGSMGSGQAEGQRSP